MTSFTVYYPETGQERPKADGYVTIGFRGERYITTKTELRGQGIKHVQTYKPSDLTEKGQWKAGWHQFRATRRAMERLRETMDLASEALL